MLFIWLPVFSFLFLRLMSKDLVLVYFRFYDDKLISGNRKISVQKIILATNSFFVFFYLTFKSIEQV